MIKYVGKNEQIEIVCSGDTIPLTGHVDVKARFWPMMAHHKVNASKRAKQLLEMALKCPEELWIVGDTEWASIMGGAAYGFYEGDKKHVLVWDPTATLNFDPTGKWVKQSQGDNAKFVGGGGNSELEAYIVVLHEFGHFEQFLTKGEWYTSRVATQRKEGQGAKFTSCQGDIEADNLGRNEWPVCDELGVVKRQSYWDRPGEIKLVSNLNKFNVQYGTG